MSAPVLVGNGPFWGLLGLLVGLGIGYHFYWRGRREEAEPDEPDMEDLEEWIEEGRS